MNVYHAGAEIDRLNAALRGCRADSLAARERVAELEQTSAELCHKCGWAFRFPDELCAHCERCALRKQVEELENFLREIASDCDGWYYPSGAGGDRNWCDELSVYLRGGAACCLHTTVENARRLEALAADAAPERKDTEPDRQALDNLVAESQALGLYDAPDHSVDANKKVVEPAKEVGEEELGNAICKKCGGTCKPGQALINNLVVTGVPDFPGDDENTRGQTLNYDHSRARMITCMKCSECGHSFTIYGDQEDE
jgi:uncharacterized OB-fold protein